MARIRINKTWVIFILALVFGLVAMVLAKTYLAAQEKALVEAADARNKQATIKVVVPTQDLERGAILDASVLATRDVPAEFTGSDAIKPEEIESYFGQKLAWPITRGAPVLKSQLDPSSKAFASLLRNGTRALTIQVDENNSTSGMVVPGNHIDLLLIHEAGKGDEVRPLFQDLLVLATGQTVQGSETPAAVPGQEKKAYSTLTLELTPAQAARLVLAQKLGSIRAILRSTTDKTVVAQDSISVQDLFDTSGRSPGTRLASVEFIIGGNSEKGINQAVLAAIAGSKQAAANQAGANLSGEAPPAALTARSQVAAAPPAAGVAR